jgi:transcriptional regulator with XRE-family HTH domain
VLAWDAWAFWRPRMVIEESTARARELGGELKRVRERAKLSGHSLARLLGWPAPKISRLENGKRGVSEVDVAIYLARCGAMPDELRSLIVLETTADTSAAYEPFYIPGLLQIESYVREMLQLGGRKPGPALNCASKRGWPGKRCSTGATRRG